MSGPTTPDPVGPPPPPPKPQVPVCAHEYGYGTLGFPYICAQCFQFVAANPTPAPIPPPDPANPPKPVGPRGYVGPVFTSRRGVWSVLAR